MAIAKKFIAATKTANGGTAYSVTPQMTADTVAELEYMLKEAYKDIVWQEKPYMIGIFEVITENNGYQHTSNKPIIEFNSKKLWTI